MIRNKKKHFICMVCYQIDNQNLCIAFRKNLVHGTLINLRRIKRNWK